MATIKYLIKGKKNPATIYLRFRDGKKIDLTVSTTKTINPDYWGSNGIRQKAEFTDKLNLADDLADLQSLIFRKRNEGIRTQTTFNRNWLEVLILDWKGKNTGEDSDLLIDRIEDYKKKLPLMVRNGKVGVSTGTIRNYNTTIQRLKKFQLNKKDNLRLTDMDFNFHEQYMRFAQTWLRLSLNSIGKDIRNVKTVCRDSKDNGFKVHDHVLTRKFNAPSEKTIFTTLNENELRIIKGFKGSDYLENAKDWLIIGCWTGCRVGDLMELTMENVLTDTKGVKFIQYFQSKTQKTVKVPLHPHVIDILQNRGSFPRVISNQRFNDYIKILCKDVGLTQTIKGTKQNRKTHLKETGEFQKWELIRSHTCRRSFATNHYDKLSNKIIMAVTGHATEKMLLNYIGEVESDHLEDFVNLWEVEETNAPKILNKKIG